MALLKSRADICQYVWLSHLSFLYHRGRHFSKWSGLVRRIGNRVVRSEALVSSCSVLEHSKVSLCYATSYSKSEDEKGFVTAEGELGTPESLPEPERPPLRHIDKYIRPECPCLSKRYTVAVLTCVGTTCGDVAVGYLRGSVSYVTRDSCSVTYKLSAAGCHYAWEWSSLRYMWGNRCRLG